MGKVLFISKKKVKNYFIIVNEILEYLEEDSLTWLSPSGGIMNDFLFFFGVNIFSYILAMNLDHLCYKTGKEIKYCISTQPKKDCLGYS